MGLKFYFGASGAGKSYQVYRDLIALAVKNPKNNYMLIVPDQFTMQTQKELVEAHPDHGIMNIDVLSFGRLSHRVFEEIGGDQTPVLDDTGKNLILRKVATKEKNNLKVLGGQLSKAGYIHEMKSVLSEFMQYGISPQQVRDMSQAAKESHGRGMLSAKLSDLATMYEAFGNYIKERYITTEESLELLARSLCKSKLFKDSVVVFDGFTGFTPVQNRVIQELMTLCKQVWVTVLVPNAENPFKLDGQQKLFYLSKKTVYDLCKLQEEAGVSREEDVTLKDNPVMRHAHNPVFSHMEQKLFRYGNKPYEGETDGLTIRKEENLSGEVRFVSRKIRELVRTQGLAFRDIAVVTGDLGHYADLFAEEFTKTGIPFFIDQTNAIMLNPFVEFVRSAWQVMIGNYSYESVFHYLRSGMTDLTDDEIDELENYVRAVGIRGKKKYHELFTRHTDETNGDGEKMEHINEIRERFVKPFRLFDDMGKKVSEQVLLLDQFITEARIEEKLLAYSEEFEAKGDYVRSKEYSQIYRLVMELFEQMHDLLGDEEVSLKEFYEILDAGLSEIRVGAIPQNVDRVVCGDIERTRLKQIKVLFFVGVNDGVIPKGGGSGGMISDLDREFLEEQDYELAPSPKQKMFTQRLYLYMNLTKPTERLYITYAAVGSDGKSKRPAYLIDTLCRMYTQLKISDARAEGEYTPESVSDALVYFVPRLREYAAGRYESEPETKERVHTLYHILSENQDHRERIQAILDQAFYEYRESVLGKKIANALYGTVLSNSVSRLECFAECEYRHFLQYGLGISEREEFSLSGREVGNLYHAVLELFSNKLRDNYTNWLNFTKEEGEKYLDEVFEEYLAQFEKSILYSSARYQYMIHTFRDVMRRSIDTIQYQLRKGEFVPKGFEVSFQSVDSLDSVNFELSEEEKVKLSGRIDRYDVSEKGDRLYVRVIDYKSSEKEFDLVSVYHGLTLQLVLYMNVALEREKKKNPEKQVLPAGLLYYHLDSPVVDSQKEQTEEEILKEIRKELKMTGILCDDKEVIGMMDDEFRESGKSDIVPASVTKSGEFAKKGCNVIGSEELGTVSNYVNWKIADISKQIMSGYMKMNPYEYKDENACTYCGYKEICRFDKELRGFENHQVPRADKEETIQQMEEVLENAVYSRSVEGD